MIDYHGTGNQCVPDLFSQALRNSLRAQNAVDDTQAGKLSSIIGRYFDISQDLAYAKSLSVCDPNQVTGFDCVTETNGMDLVMCGITRNQIN